MSFDFGYGYQSRIKVTMTFLIAIHNLLHILIDSYGDVFEMAYSNN